jgi:hypothetical protein
MKKWVTAVAVVVALVGAGVLVYWQWDSIWAFVFSPIGGFVAKILFTGKALKVAAGVAFAVGAGLVAARKKLRRGNPEPELAPPVFGPPEENAAPAEGPPSTPEALPPSAPEVLTSTGTGTATTTGWQTAPASRPT